ncbi:MAG: hypothetical protein QM784_09770 [Polyangiaceae bacterium]
MLPRLLRLRHYLYVYGGAGDVVPGLAGTLGSPEQLSQLFGAVSVNRPNSNQ